MAAHLLLFPFLTILVCSAPSLGVVAQSAYWQKLFPNTSIPTAISTALPLHINTVPLDNWVDSDEVVIQGYAAGDDKCKVDGHGGGPRPPFLKSRFVLPKDLRVGSHITLQLKPMLAITTKFPTHQDIPPFSSHRLVENLIYFNITNNSKAAYVMNLTLHKCEVREPINGKWQHCATSLHDLLKFANDTLGLKGLQAVSPPSASAEGLSHYRVASAKPLAAEGKLLLCHRYGFPYAVFYCHQPPATRAFSVLLAGHSDELDTITICHGETARWSPYYIGFRALGVHPGTPICHFLHSHDLIWYLK